MNTTSHPNRPTPPNITEGARRAFLELASAWEEYATVTGDPAKAATARMCARQLREGVQSALDSAHPAPKEGGESVAALISFVSLLEYNGTVAKEVGAQVREHIAALELRLAEKTREVEALKKDYYDVADAVARESTSPADLCQRARETRARLTQAEKLLDGVTAWAESIEVVHAHPFLNNRVIVDARAHVAQSKTT